jgi:hypothetical protein
MLYTILLKLRLELRGPSPVDILSAVIGEHLLGNTILRRGLTIEFQYIIRRLRHAKAKSNDITGVVVDKSNEVDLAAAHAKHHDVALPHLVGRAALESAGLLDIALAGMGSHTCKARPRKRPAHRGAARRQQEPPPQRGNYPPNAESGVLTLDRYNLLRYRRMNLGPCFPRPGG